MAQESHRVLLWPPPIGNFPDLSRHMRELASRTEIAPAGIASQLGAKFKAIIARSFPVPLFDAGKCQCRALPAASEPWV